MNTGIQDAYNLAWKLALYIKGAARASVLDSYSAERHAVAQSVLKMTDLMTKVNTFKNPVARAIRNRLAPMLFEQGMVRRRIGNDITELAVNYRKSAIVAEHKVSLAHAGISARSNKELPELGEWFTFDIGPSAGDRAPDGILFDPKGDNAVRMFEILRGTEHHLLLFSGARTTASGARKLADIANFTTDHFGRWIRVHLISPSEKYWHELPRSGSCFTDSDLKVHHKYGAASECLYLIRPDGYVGFRSLPADREVLSNYLDGLFISPAV